MQTFLPYSNFERSAKCLDRQRLGKQRVEAYQILRCLVGEQLGWRSHPAVKMWIGCEKRLAEYTFAICNEWISRGYKDSIKQKTADLIFRNFQIFYRKRKYPKWLGNQEFHQSHQSNLIRKKPEHYQKYFPNIPNNILYIWPI